MTKGMTKGPWSCATGLEGLGAEAAARLQLRRQRRRVRRPRRAIAALRAHFRGRGASSAELRLRASRTVSCFFCSVSSLQLRRVCRPRLQDGRARRFHVSRENAGPTGRFHASREIFRVQEIRPLRSNSEKRTTAGHSSKAARNRASGGKSNAHAHVCISAVPVSGVPKV